MNTASKISNTGDQLNTAFQPVTYANLNEALGRQSAALSHSVASIAFVLPQAPPKRVVLCAEKGSTLSTTT